MLIALLRVRGLVTAMASLLCLIDLLVDEPKILRRLADETSILFDLQRLEESEVLLGYSEIRSVGELFLV